LHAALHERLVWRLVVKLLFLWFVFEGDITHARAGLAPDNSTPKEYKNATSNGHFGICVWINSQSGHRFQKALY